ncbi:MAG: C39 family peptidase [Betaproteobacteria bacterium]|nr:C39 family peptidase [Betaproteobacteria bacterium]
MVLVLAHSASGQAASRLNLSIPGAGPYSVPVVSFQARKFLTTVHQRYDYSCGSAAVATLLDYQYHAHITEAQAFQWMWTHGNRAKIKAQGFSMLDMKHYLATLGFSSNGYIAPLTKLEDARVPAIVLISQNGYHHFVVVKGIEGGRVLLGDPSAGTRAVSRQEFRKIWIRHLLFVITAPAAKPVFNGRLDWSMEPQAPLGPAVDSGSLDQLMLLRPGPDQYQF